MNSFNTTTKTNTYTVVDIRKTFEGFEADLRMIARRTDKWSMDYVEQLIYDVLKLAENKYLKTIDITLLNSADTPLRAVRYTVNEEGKATSSERPGSNDWSNLPNTRLSMILNYQPNWLRLTAAEKTDFMQRNGFKIPWTASSIDTTYSHLSGQSGQLYGSNGYELKKQNFR